MSNYLVNVPSHSKKLPNEIAKSWHQINLDNMEENMTCIRVLCCIEQHNIMYVLQDCIENKPMQCAQIPYFRE